VTTAELILMLMTAAAAAGVPLTLALASFLALFLSSPKNPLFPLPTLTEEERKQQEEWVRQARERQEKARKEAAEAKARQQAEAEARLNAVITEVVSHVAFTAKRVQVGMMKTGERAIGVVEAEVPYTSDDTDVRPIQSMSEIPRLMHAELGQPSELMLVRLATGEALVQSNIERTPVYEDVHEPVWEERRRVLYNLRDRSGSMHAAPVRVVTDKEADGLIHFLMHHSPDGGTNIPRAISAAISDLACESYDQADIVIVTDGEDQAGLEPAKIRKQLKDAKIRLHAILLGADNKALRDCADVYQIIQPDLTFQPPVRRG
jgi:hypothetical protein